MAHITSDGKIVVIVKWGTWFTNAECTSMNFTYSFSDGMLELQWGKQVHSCHKDTLATADAMCRMKRKYISQIVPANPWTSSHLNLSDFSHGDASKRKFMLWKYKILMTLLFILVLAADIRGKSGQLVCVRETGQCYCEMRVAVHNCASPTTWSDICVKLKRGSNFRIFFFSFVVIESNK
jgi:hypothetical protein